MKAKKVLYINDYFNDENSLNTCEDRQMPYNHLWGSDIDDNRIVFKRCLVKTSKRGKLWTLVQNIKALINGLRCDVIYSAVPGYDYLFLLLKRLGLSSKQIITVLHHPARKLRLVSQYNKCICICPEIPCLYPELNERIEYIFWGPDIEFYKNSGGGNINHTIDFISAGKTHRDYALMKEGLQELGATYKIVGEHSQSGNEMSYPDLLKEYEQSRFICIPMEVKDEALLIGLTSFNDAIALGKPFLMSDNSRIGVDIDSLKLGRTYKAGDISSFKESAEYLLSLSDSEYNEMSENCRKFAEENSYDRFKSKIHSIITG